MLQISYQNDLLYKTLYSKSIKIDCIFKERFFPYRLCILILLLLLFGLLQFFILFLSEDFFPKIVIKYYYPLNNISYWLFSDLCLFWIYFIFNYHYFVSKQKTSLKTLIFCLYCYISMNFFFFSNAHNIYVI